MKRKFLAIALAAIMTAGSCFTALASESTASSVPAEENATAEANATAEEAAGSGAASTEEDAGAGETPGKEDASAGEASGEDRTESKEDSLTAAVTMILKGIEESLSSANYNLSDILTGLMSNIDPAAIMEQFSLDSLTDTLWGDVDQLGSTVTGIFSGLGDAVTGVVAAVGSSESGEDMMSGVIGAIVPFFTDSGALELLLGQYIGPEGVVTHVLDIIATSKGDLAVIVASLKSDTGGYDVAKIVGVLGTAKQETNGALLIDGVEITSEDISEAVRGAIQELGLGAVPGADAASSVLAAADSAAADSAAESAGTGSADSGSVAAESAGTDSAAA